MKNHLLFSSTLAVVLLFSACATESREVTMMNDAPPMMGHDMDSMMIQSDEAFISMMIPHHQEAIDTAEVILDKSQNEELKAMAQEIVETQTLEIAQMETWGKEWFGTSFKASDDYEEMMPDLSMLEGDALDQAFIEGMIEHHQMAIIMAYEVQMITERPELLKMADAIIDAQSAEIKWMKTWLK